MNKRLYKALFNIIGILEVTALLWIFCDAFKIFENILIFLLTYVNI